jgi:hypothetical protein
MPDERSAANLINVVEEEELLMKALPRIKFWLIMAVVATLALASVPVFAHEDREIEGYHLTVGFMEEPALEGSRNAVSLEVMKPPEGAAHEHGENPQSNPSGSGTGAEQSNAELVPVEGLDSTLQVEVTHIPTGVSKVMPLRPVFGEPGHYAADLIPTAPGQYRFRFFGVVEGMNIDETFESGPDTFDNVEETKALQFPESLPAAREVEGAVRGTQATAQEAQETASSASTLGMIGIVLGAVGVMFGIGGVVLSMRRR